MTLHVFWFFLCINLTFICKGQPYHSYFESSAKWYYFHKFDFNPFPPPLYSSDTWIYDLHGDTCIDGLCYIKLFRNYTDYVGAIRNDYLGKKVFIVPSISNQELLMYDFNINIGDSIITGNGNKFVCFSIDSVLISGAYERRFNLYILNSGLSFYDQWIYGIGSSQLLYGPVDGLFSGFENIYNLQCFQNDSGLSFHMDNTLDCYSNVLIGSNNDLPLDFEFTFTPNPVSNDCRIIIHSRDIVQLSLINLLGVSIKDIKIGPTLVIINVTDIKNGIYYLRFVFKNGNSCCKKILIIH